jgi:hypothetical protein
VRAAAGLQRLNKRIALAIKKYPLETWYFELLELLPFDCTEQELRIAEQRHIDRLGTSDPQCGFNVRPALPMKTSLLTIPDVAQVLGISQGCAYEAVKKGTLPARKFCNRFVVPRTVLERMLEGAEPFP